MSGGRHGERGAALLLVMVSIAVLTALAVDLAYESSVSLRIAGNARDELRAAYRARSGVALSRLVLSFQQTLDDSVPAAAGIPMPRVQIWRLIPVDSDLAAGLFGEGAARPEAAPRASPAVQPAAARAEAPSYRGTAPAPGSAPGFTAGIDDEDRKVNAQLDAFRTNPLLAPQVQAILQLTCDPRWDFLFGREDDGTGRTSREELLVRLREWVDGSKSSSSLVATFGATSCATDVAQVPFEDAFGDKNRPYDRGQDRYKAKNARMDSLDELYMVAGVGDDFMAAFGDALTVYVPRDAKRNVNQDVADPQALVDLATIVAAPRNQAALLDPEFAKRLQKIVAEMSYGGILSLTTQQFGQAVQSAGVTVNASALAPAAATTTKTNVNSPFTDRSSTFRIRASGAAGDVTKRIDAAVRLVKPQAGQPVAAPGRLVYWREE